MKRARAPARMQEDALGFYEFRTMSAGKTIWTVEHYCRDDLDALDKAEKSQSEMEIRVWQGGHQITRESDGA